MNIILPRFLLPLLATLPLSTSAWAAYDHDQDGLGDVWQLKYRPTGPAGADDDGDGLTNAEESKAGTDPNQADSYLYVYDLVYQAEGGTIQWPSVKGKSYALQTCTDLRSWENLGLPMMGVDGLLSQPLSAAEGLRFYRVGVTDRDSDLDGVTDWEEAQLGFDPHLPDSQGRGSDAIALASALEEPIVLSLSVEDAVAAEAGLDKARLLLTRSGGLAPVDVLFAMTGSAIPGLDYDALPATVHLALGERAVSLWISPLPDDLEEGSESLTVQLQPHASYQLSGPAVGQVTIHDPAEKLFLSSLRAADVYSLGYGTGSLLLSADRTSARISLFLANLAGMPSETRLVLETSGPSRDTLVVLPPGQVADYQWDLSVYAEAEATAILEALDRQHLHFEVSSSQFPGPELAGRLENALAERPMPVPSTPPPFDGETLPTEAEAVRFLVQTTFGPTQAEIERVQQIGYAAWIDEQLALPATHHLPYIDALIEAAADPLNPMVYQNQRQEAWWLHAISAPDQLRQRMAFALSEIFVVSDQSSVLKNEVVDLTVYYDLLLRHSFGNYRSLLEDITLNPAMGRYLTHLKNAKADPVKGTFPDENYAREVMQLFSIGLVQLHPDGTAILDGNGLPIPTYGQEEIVGLAKVFTGWSWHNPDGKRSWNYSVSDYRNPMSLYPSYHETGAKQLLNGVVQPANRSGQEDLAAVLDQLHQHPNTGPFLSRQLIQRFVTSNPSPDYVYRVAQAFADNGQGVRGDLRAVLKAILLDYEARSPDLRTYQGYGKQKEPLLRVAQTFRSFNASAASGLWKYWTPDKDVGQAALRAPTVFNFFEPYYQLPGPVTELGLLSPEY